MLAPFYAETSTPASDWPRWQSVAEWLAILLVFIVQGSWAAPEVNEAYYLGKAAHYWNPQAIPGDFFLNSADTHWVFYCTVGWWTKWLSLPAFAWCGRLLTWTLLAAIWRRLSVAVVPARWASVLTAGLLVLLSDRMHMAGEWLIGGFEAKGFAYVLIFAALERSLRGAWRAVWLLVGAAAAFHVLAGGWAAIALACAWWWSGPQRPALRSQLPALLCGAALALLGVLPAVMMNWGVPQAIVNEANQIYVYERLGHHLTPRDFPLTHVLRFVALTGSWGLLAVAARSAPRLRPLCGFVSAAAAIAATGAGVDAACRSHPALGAALLRFYWFRLSDVAVPLGVALLGTWLALRALRERPRLAWACLTAAAALATLHLGIRAGQWNWPPRALEAEFPGQEEWVDACRWVASSGRIPADACFITPRWSGTFKWYARRAEVVNWKEVPQDARSILEWRRRLADLYASGSDDPTQAWFFSMADHTPEEVYVLSRRYGAHYMIMCSLPLAFPKLYDNEVYAVYQITDPAQ